jgi:hypothetical protein
LDIGKQTDWGRSSRPREVEDWSKDRRELGQGVCGLGQEEQAVGPLGAEGLL